MSPCPAPLLAALVVVLALGHAGATPEDPAPRPPAHQEPGDGEGGGRKGPAPPLSAGGPPVHDIEYPTGIAPEAKAYIEKGDAAVRAALTSLKSAAAGIEEAIGFYRKAAEFAPNEPLPWFRISRAHLHTLSYASALEPARKAVELSPRSAELLSFRGDAYARLHRWSEAAADWDEAQKQDPKSDLPRIMRAFWILQRERKLDQVAQELEAVLKRDPGAKPLARWLSEVRREATWPDLKDWPARGGTTHETARYIIRTNADPPLAKFFGGHAEKIYKFYTSKFPPIPGGAPKFPIYIFKDEGSFLRGTEAGAGAAGYYDPQMRKLVLFILSEDLKNTAARTLEERYANTLLVLYHEAFHQYSHFYLEDIPSWFAEGQADYFGGARFAPGASTPVIGPNAWRVDHIKDVLASGDQIAMARLIQMTQGEMYNEAGSQNYAQAWSFVHFLWSDAALFKQYLKPYFEALQKGRGLGEAYRDVFGKTDWPALEVKWRAHCRSLVVGEKKK